MVTAPHIWNSNSSGDTQDLSFAEFWKRDSRHCKMSEVLDLLRMKRIILSTQRSCHMDITIKYQIGPNFTAHPIKRDITLLANCAGIAVKVGYTAVTQANV